MKVTKQSLALRVVDERQILRHFSFSEIQLLFDFDPDILPEDREELYVHVVKVHFQVCVLQCTLQCSKPMDLLL